FRGVVEYPVREVGRYECQEQLSVVNAPIEIGGSKVVCDELGPSWCDHGSEPAEGGSQFHPIAWVPWYVCSGLGHGQHPRTRSSSWRGNEPRRGHLYANLHRRPETGRDICSDTRIMAIHAEASDSPVAAIEFRATFAELGITQRRAAKLFNVSPRHLRRWQHGSRRLPHAVGIVCNLLTMGMVTIEQIEAAAPVLVRTNGSAKPEPPGPLLLEEAPAQAALARAEAATLANPGPTTVAEKVCALTPEICHWPLGDPRDRDFCFCGPPVAEPPYCERHRAMAYLAPRTGSGHGVRIGFVAHGRYGRPSIPGAFSATGASRAPKILFDRAGDLPSSAPPPA